MVDAGADSVVPALPVDQAAESLIRAAPVYGPIIIGLALFVIWLIRIGLDKDKLLQSKDEEITAAKDAHIADLKLNIPAMHDLRETILAEIHSRGQGRRT